MNGPAPEVAAVESAAEPIPPESANFSPQPDRWDTAMPEWRRYEQQRDAPYVKGHWYDPFNRNRLKGDYPIFGQRWFFNFTGTSETAVDGRRLPLPSGVDTERPDSGDFFGRGEQALLTQNLRFSFDLFRGDTSFRPVDFRVRFTPEINLNFLQTRERGIVNMDPREGINRFDTHIGLQEAFVEAKIRDLSPNYDFVSVRAGIQQFTSDFRGFLFSEEQPGVRLFGNLRSNRLAYNLAWFNFLEKNTNSGLNTFQNRGQQVYVANIYIQDFLAKGYTTEFSFHYNRDDASIHYDDNGFLVRPAPAGAVVNGDVNAHAIRAYYLGWASNGHIGRINLSHAFYQALGHDDFNPIAGRRVDINARMAALEVSVDKDWVRYRASFFYASGDSSNRSGASRTDGTAHGFDTIVDDTHFAGSAFSFWDHEGLRLTGTGIALMNPVEPAAQPAFEQRGRPGQLRKSRTLLIQSGRGFQRDAQAARIRKRQLFTFRPDRTAGAVVVPAPDSSQHRHRPGHGHGISPPAQRKHCPHGRHIVAGSRPRFRRNLQRQDSILSIRQNKVSVLKCRRERPRSCSSGKKL